MPRPVSEQRQTLSRAAIAAAARRIADREGLDAITLRRLAAEFDTGQASLYRHIAGRAELLGLLADGIVAAYPVPSDAATDPVAAVISQWQDMHDQLAARPWTARLIADGTHSDRGDELATALIAQLERAGLSPDTAVRTYRSLWNLLLGYLLNAHHFGRSVTGGRRPARRGSKVSDDGFSWAMDRLLAGVRKDPRD